MLCLNRYCVVTPINNIIYQIRFKKWYDNKSNNVGVCISKNELGIWNDDEIKHMILHGILPDVTNLEIGYQAFTKLINHSKDNIIGNNSIKFGKHLPYRKQVFGIKELLQNIFTFLSHLDRLTCNGLCFGLLDTLAVIPCGQPITYRLLNTRVLNSRIYYLTTTFEATLSIIADIYVDNLNPFDCFNHKWKHLKTLKFNSCHLYKCIRTNALKAFNDNVLAYPTSICVDYGGTRVRGFFSALDLYPLDRLYVIHNFAFPKCKVMSVIDSLAHRNIGPVGYESELELSDSIEYLEYQDITLGVNTFRRSSSNVKYLKMWDVERYNDDEDYISLMMGAFLSKFKNLVCISLKDIYDGEVMTDIDRVCDTPVKYKGILNLLKKRVKLLHIENGRLDKYVGRNSEDLADLLDILSRSLKGTNMVCDLDHILVNMVNFDAGIKIMKNLFDRVNECYLNKINIRIQGRIDVEEIDSYNPEDIIKAEKFVAKVVQVYDDKHYQFGLETHDISHEILSKHKMDGGMSICLCYLKHLQFFSFSITLGDIDLIKELINERSVYEQKFQHLRGIDDRAVKAE